MSEQLPTRTEAEFVEAARGRPGLVDELRRGSVAALVEFFELAGVQVASAVIRSR